MTHVRERTPHNVAVQLADAQHVMIVPVMDYLRRVRSTKSPNSRSWKALQLIGSAFRARELV